MTTCFILVPGESPWIEEPGGYCPLDCKDMDMTERLSIHIYTYIHAFMCYFI